jgi:hypothetical protein
MKVTWIFLPGQGSHDAQENISSSEKSDPGKQ